MAKDKNIPLRGVFAPIPTPFDPNGDIDFDHLQSNITRWNKEPLSGYVVGGSNGEYVSLSIQERIQVVRAVKEWMPADRFLIAGSGMHSTRGSVELTQKMAEVGANAVLVVTPSYYKNRMFPKALEAHYTEVADSSPLPVILYNVPANTGLDLPAETVIRLATHRNIIGIKESGGSVAKIGRMVHHTSDDFQVLSGSAGFMLGALVMGAIGAIAALANIAGKELAQLLNLFTQGDVEEARKVQHPLIEINLAVTTTYGVPGIKAAMDMLGYYGGPVRSPLLSLSSTERANLETALIRAELM